MLMMTSENVKIVHLKDTLSIDAPPTTSCSGEKTCKSQKEKQKRVITKTKKWKDYYAENSEEKNMNILSCLAAGEGVDPNEEIVRGNEPIFQNENDVLFVESQITIKINGYKSQDLKKKKFNAQNFVEKKDVIEKLISCNLKCFYCKNPCFLLYENVREPRQWTLERIDNSMGHDKSNVVIACLSCNIKRKIMNCEKFIFSSKCKNIIKMSETEQT